MRVLIVEDDKVLNHTLGYNLISAGCQVTSTYNYREADSELAHNQVDLIVLDVNLPDGNGFDLCKKWRNRINTPIIFLTANDNEGFLGLDYEQWGDQCISVLLE